MNAQQLSDHADQLSENGMLKLAGRFMMIVSGPAIIWLGTTLWIMYGDQARFTVKIDFLTQQIVDLSKNQYRDGDAARDIKAQDQKNMEQDRRIGVVESRIDRIEGRRQLPQ